MSAIVPKVRFAVKERLLKNLYRCRNAGLHLRYLIIVNLLNGRGAYPTATALGVHNTTVYRVAQRFREHGEWKPQKIRSCRTAMASVAPRFSFPRVNENQKDKAKAN